MKYCRFGDDRYDLCVHDEYLKHIMHYGWKAMLLGSIWEEIKNDQIMVMGMEGEEGHIDEKLS